MLCKLKRIGERRDDMKKRRSRLAVLFLCLTVLAGCTDAGRLSLNTSPDPLPPQEQPAPEKAISAAQEQPAPEKAISAAQEQSAPENAVSAAQEQTPALQTPAPPALEAAGEIRMMGVPMTVLTDGKTRFLPAARTLRIAGVEVQEEESAVLFELNGSCKLEDGSGLFLRNAERTVLEAAARVQEGELYAPIKLLAALLSLERGETEDGTEYYAKRTELGEIPPDVNVPILMYHAVSDDCWGFPELFVSPSEMEQQLAWLTENGYDAIWMEDLCHLEDYDKPVILTFDDGYDDNYTELFPLLQKYNVKATFFVIAGSLGQTHKMTAEQVTEVSQSGLVSVQSHSMTHPYLNELDEERLDWELGECQRVIASLTGKIPNVLCYPSGGYNWLTIEVAKQNGYDYGIRMEGCLYHTLADPFRIERCYIARETSLEEFQNYLRLTDG